MRLYTDGHWRSVWDACVIYLTWPLVIGSLKMLIPGVNRATEICERLMFLVLCVVFHLSALWSVEAWERVDWSSRVLSCSLSFIQHRRQKRQDTILRTSLAQNLTSIPWLMTLPFLLISLCLCQESSELKTIINSAKPNRSTVRSLHTCTHQPGA